MRNNTNIKRAWSTNNGITFCSNICPFLCVETFFDSSDNLRTRLYLKQSDSMQKNEESVSIGKLQKRLWLITSIILMTSAFIAAIHFNNFYLVISALFFSNLIMFPLFDSISYWHNIKSKKGKQHSMGNFHSAEHMVINAYHKLQRVPTLHEVKKFSRFSKNCGSMPRFLWFIICVPVCFMPTAFYYDIRTSILLLSLYYMFLLIAIHHGWLTFFQILVTNKPTDRELLLAIEALTQFEIMEEKIINGKIVFTTKV